MACLVAPRRRPDRTRLAGDRGADEERAARRRPCPARSRAPSTRCTSSRPRLLQLYGGEGRGARRPASGSRRRAAVPWTPSLGGEVILDRTSGRGGTAPTRPARTPRRCARSRPSAARRRRPGRAPLDEPARARRASSKPPVAQRLEPRGCGSTSSRCRSTAARPPARRSGRAAPPGPDAAPKFDSPKRARDQLARGTSTRRTTRCGRTTSRRCGGAWSRRSTRCPAT